MTLTKQTRWGLIAITSMALLGVFAPLLAPNSPIEFNDSVAGRHLPPLSSRIAVQLKDGSWILADKSEATPTGLSIERLGLPEIIAREDLAESTGGYSGELRFFLLGTDKFSRDLWSRVAYGARISLSIGVMAGLLSLFLGTAIGALAALSKGWVDGLLMRLVDALLMFPRLFLLLAVVALVGDQTWLIIVLLGCTSWMSVSRLIRAEILTLRERDFVVAARSTGQRPLKVFLTHMLPSAIPPAIIDTTLRIGDLILLEAALSFLGLGVQPPTPSWGNIVSDGAQVVLSAWWVALFPVVAIATTVIAFNVFGDGLRDSIDPRLADDISHS